jgi:endonuclease/exonuclease/phosphatase family metal-dependent hydrolase
MINILSWNVLAQDYIDNSYKDYIDYLDFDVRSKKIINILHKIDSDIIFLQEVDYKLYKLLKIEFQDYYFGKLEKKCWAECSTQTFNLIMSKYKIKLIKYFKLNEFNNYQGIFRVNINKQNIYLVNVHLYDKNKKVRNMEIKKIFRILNILNITDKIIIGGDFNSNITNNQDLFYKNNFKIIGYPKNKFTYQLNNEYLAIDYFIVNVINNIKNIKVKIYKPNIPLLKYYGSDHLPIILNIFK